MATEQTRFKFKGYRIVKSEMNVNPDVAIDKKLNVAFSGIKRAEMESEYLLDLKASISNEARSLEIIIEMRGAFVFDRALSDAEKERFFTGNAPAIMFPYLRAFVSNITAMAGMEPVILPTINFTEGLRTAKVD